MRKLMGHSRPVIIKDQGRPVDSKSHRYAKGPGKRYPKGMRLQKRVVEAVERDTLEVARLTASMTREFELTMRYYLAHSSTTGSYKSVMLHRAEALKGCRRENLHAIVMPGGHGKTHLCNRYGFIDVDNLVDRISAAELFDMRMKCVVSNTKEWVEHNTQWYIAINKTLSLMTFDRPTVVLVHSEECAIEIGAGILGVITLEEGCFEKNIQYRDVIGVTFSRISRTFVKARSLNHVVECEDNEDVERVVLDLCNLYNIPVACPYKFGYSVTNSCYKEYVPKWLLEGQLDKRRFEDVDLVLELYEAKKIPKECVDYFIREMCPIKKAYGFGTTMNEWASLCSKVVGNIGEYVAFDLSGDLFELFPPGSQAERHRVNVTLRRLNEQLSILKDPECDTIMGRHVGDRHVFVAGIVSHWLGIGRHWELADQMFPFYLVRQGMWSEVMSEFHNLIRVSNWYCSTPIDEEVRQGMMYLQMFTGRKMYTADWAKVIDERKLRNSKLFVSFDIERGLWTRRQYLDDFDAAISQAYVGMYADPRPIRIENFVDFWKRRRSWVAKGSTVLNSLGKEVLRYSVRFFDEMSKVIEMRHNKKSLFENHEVIDLIDETERSWNYTKAVPKLNETGKERELLPGTLMHYLVFSYVLFVAEKQPPVGSTRLNVNDDDNILYFDRKMVSTYHHMLYDWANFNAQHSSEDMARVIEGLDQIPGAPKDYGYFCRAIAESFFNMYLIDPDGKEHKLERGLFSGWRGTTWINTVLNFVYVNVAVRCCERLYGDFDSVYFDHGGDDLDIAFRSPKDCFRLVEVMDAIGYEATTIKQMIDKKAEFFRNTVTIEGVFASPSRALANFVSGNWETAGAKTVSEKTMSIMDQVAKLERRGVEAEFCQALMRMALNHWLKIKVEDEWFCLKPEILHGAADCGGLGIPDEEGKVWEIEFVDKVSNVEALRAELPGMHCSEDYVSVIEEELARHKLAIFDKKGLTERMAKQSYDLEMFEERKVLMEMNKCRILVRGYREVVVPQWDNLLFQEFLEFTSSHREGLNLGKIEALEEFVGHIGYDGRVLDKQDLMILYLNKKRVLPHVVEFRGDVYYRRLCPDFMANHIDKYVRWRANEYNLDADRMQWEFQTLCYMASEVYGHRA
nr:putative RNA-dependent RNA polymerase [Poaceae Liege alphachrysovirus 1]